MGAVKRVGVTCYIVVVIQAIWVICYSVHLFSISIRCSGLAAVSSRGQPLTLSPGCTETLFRQLAR